jgi:ATP-dependent RNA helicase DHX29
MAKKKKTQLKPVARGFATTSVPKKAAPLEKEAETLAGLTSNVEEEVCKTVIGPISSSAAASVQTQVDEFDPEKVEEQSLQNLVDRLQSTTEKDIVRTVKVQWYTYYHRGLCLHRT